jgi:hypothetical protein
MFAFDTAMALTCVHGPHDKIQRCVVHARQHGKTRRLLTPRCFRTNSPAITRAAWCLS